MFLAGEKSSAHFVYIKPKFLHKALMEKNEININFSINHFHKHLFYKRQIM